MGAFDDLIPQQGGTAVADNPFEDLIPKEIAPPGTFPADDARIVAPRMPATGEMSTTYGGPPKPFIPRSYGELMSEGEMESPMAPRVDPSEPRFALPKVPIPKTDPFLLAAGKEIINVAKSVPEFFTSDLGIASAIAGKIAPRVVTGAFSLDLAKAATEQARQTVENWKTLTPAEKATALVDIFGSMLFSIGTGRHALGKTERTITRAIAPVTRGTPETNKQELEAAFQAALPPEGEGYVPKGFVPITQEGVTDASQVASPTQVSELEVRPPMGEKARVRQQGQAAAPSPPLEEAPPPNQPAPVAPPEPSETELEYGTGGEMPAYTEPGQRPLPPTIPKAAPPEPPPTPPPPTVPTETTPSKQKFPVREVPVAQIAARPELMQFKSISDPETGENAAEKITGKWDERFAGNLLLWEPANPVQYGLTGEQRYIVANGHHRLAFGQRQGVEVFNSQILREADGFTAKDARVYAAEANIVDGKGTIYDQVKYLRNLEGARSPDAEMAARSRLGSRGAQAASIAFNAGDDLYAAFLNEKVTPAQAEAIAVAAPKDADGQRIGVNFALQGKSPDFLTAVIKRSKETAKASNQTLDLFGADDSAMKQMEADEDKASEIRAGIRKQIRAVENAAKNPTEAKKWGVNVKDPKGILKKVGQLNAELERWENWWLHPDLVAKVRGEAPPPEAPKPEPLPPPEPSETELEYGEGGEMPSYTEPGQRPTPAIPSTPPPPGARDPFSVGNKIRFGNNPQPWTIVAETTDPKFPDERIFLVKNDRTNETQETGTKGITSIQARAPGEKPKAPARDLDAELRALKLDPSVFPDKASKIAAIARAQAKAAGGQSAPPPKTPTITDDQAAKLRERLKAKFGQKKPPTTLEARLPETPESKAAAQERAHLRKEREDFEKSIFNDAVQLGAHYIESGAHRFPEWSDRMREDFGEQIEPFLKSIYETAKVTIESPGSESVVGRRPGLQPGLRPPQERIILARPENTKAVDESIIPAELTTHLDAHQRQGAATALQSINKLGGFLNADGTGVGKTRQSITVAHYFAKQGNKVIIVTKSETIKPDWASNTFGGSYAYDGGQMGVKIKLARHGDVAPGEIGVTTYYHKYLAELAAKVDGNTVLIFDESHALKNDSAQAKAALQATQRAKAVMFMSATPADKPEHIYYLAPIGIMEGKTTQAALRDLGMTLVERDVRVKDGRGNFVTRKVQYWAPDQRVSDQEREQRFSSLFDRMTGNGQMIKREISMEGTHVQVLKVTLPPAAHEKMQGILDFFGYDNVDQLEGLQKAIVLGHQRRQQEPFKIASTVMLAQRELTAGRQVVIFVSRVNYSEVAKWETMISATGEREKVRVVMEGGGSEGTAKLMREALEDAGIHDIAEIHGEADQSSLGAMADFQAGKKRVVIATIESGGTGINLDDTFGNRPRSMIVVTAPFDAVGNVQAAGRIWRLKTLSDAKFFYLFGDTDVDHWNADIIGSKMAMLGAVVEGQVRHLDISNPEAVSTDDFHGQMARGEQGRAPVAQPEAPRAAPKLDWRPFKTKAGKDKFVAPATKEFWDWYNANGKGDNPLGLRPSKWKDQWQVWSDRIPPSGEVEALAPPAEVAGLHPTELQSRLTENWGIGESSPVSVVQSDKTALAWVELDADRKPTRIVFNANRISSPKVLDWALEHELAHWFDLEQTDLARSLQDTMSNGEWTSILDTVAKANYSQDAFGDEISARAIQKLAVSWKGRSWFEKIVGNIARFAHEKLGLNLTRLAAENIAARGIVQSLKRVTEAQATGKPAESLEARLSEEERDSLEGERTPGTRIRQVAGQKIGAEYVPENIRILDDNVCTMVFSGVNEPVSIERTRDAKRIFDLMTNPDTRGQYAVQVENATGPGGASRLRNEIWGYAVNMLQTKGDVSLFNAMRLRSADIEVMGMGDRAIADYGIIGSTSTAAFHLRLAQEMVMQGLWKPIIKYTNAQLKAAGEAMGIGDTALRNIMDAINSITRQINPEEWENLIRSGSDSKGRTLEELLRLESPEHKAAEEVVKAIPPEVIQAIPEAQRNTILETVYKWLARDVGKAYEEHFKQGLSEELTANFAISQDKANQIADQTWNRKVNLVTEKTRRLLDAELRSLDNLAEKTAQGFVKQWEQAEWIKPQTTNAIKDLVRDALKGIGPMDAENVMGTRVAFQRTLESYGLSPHTANLLTQAVWSKRQEEFLNANMRAMKRASESLSLKSLVESIKSSPYLAQKDPQWRLDTAKRWFESNGLSPHAAEQAAKMFDLQFINRFADAARKVAEQALRQPDHPTIPKLITAIRAGLTDPTKEWPEEIAKLNGFKNLTPEQHQKLAELEQKHTKPDLSPEEQVAIVEEMMGIMRHVGDPSGHMLKTIGESFAASLLSGLRTFTLHIFQPLTHTLGTFMIHSAFKPQDFPALCKAMLDAGKAWKPAYKYAWTHDAYSFSSEQMGYHANELKRQFEIAQREWKSGKYAKAITRFSIGWQQYVIRSLMTSNQAGMRVVQRWKLALYGSMAMRRAGYGTREISDMVDYAANMRKNHYDSLLENHNPTDAAAIADHWANVDIARYIENRGESKGLPGLGAKVAEAALYDAFSVVGRKAPGIREKDEGFASRLLGVNKAMEFTSKMRSEGGPMSILSIMAVGFMNIPLRLTRFYANFGPYGLFVRGPVNRYMQTHPRSEWPKWMQRVVGDKDTFWQQSYKNDLQAQAHFREALVGTGLLLAFAAYQHFNHTSDDDAEKRPFAMFATGSGPKNKTLRDSWTKRGYRPFSLHVIIGGRVAAAIPITRVGEILAYPLGLAAAQDDLAWRRKEEEAIGRGKKEPAARELLAAAGTYYEIVGAQGVFQSFGHLSQLGRGEGGIPRAIAMEAGSLAAGLVPGHGILNSVTGLIWGPVDRSSIEAGLVANFPVVNVLVNGRSINRFGDAMGDQTWFAKMAQTGIPIALRVSDTTENRRLYQMVLNSGAPPPDLRRYIVEEKYGPLTQGEWRKFAQTSGEAIKKMALDNIDTLETMPPQAVRAFMEHAGESANAQAAAALKLEPIQQPGRMTAGGGSGGGGVAAGPAAMLPSAPRASAMGLPRAEGAPLGVSAPRAAGGAVPMPSGRAVGARLPSGRGGLATRRIGLSRVRSGIRTPRLVSGRLRSRSRRVGRIRLGRSRRGRRIRLRA